MRVVVTGGSGFIGSHLVKGLVNEGREVHIIGGPPAAESKNLRNLGVRAEFKRFDLRDYGQALEAIGKAEVVFHLAARIGNIEYLHMGRMAELTALQTNMLIDANVLRACLEKRVKKIVYASSTAVYPLDRQLTPDAILSEADLVFPFERFALYPDGGYGWAKLVGELQLNQMEDMAIGIARIFNVYGENEPLDEKAHAVGDLIRKAVLYPESDFRVWGNGEQSRDFLYVADCVTALLKLEKKATSPPVTVNIGSGRATRIKEVVEKIIEVSGKKMEPTYDRGKPSGPLGRTADISRAKTLLDWQPETSLDTGLRRTYVWAEREISKIRE